MAQARVVTERKDPLTWTTVSTSEVNGVLYADDDELMLLMDELVEDDRELLERLSQQ